MYFTVNIPLNVGFLIVLIFSVYVHPLNMDFHLF